MSVLVPIRQEGAVIGDTARTILGQRFAGTVEFLLIDGASTDGTRAILERLREKDDRVQVLDNPRGDLASALGIGLRAARGEFVAKMDAHTSFPLTYLQVGVDRLRVGDVNWVSGPPIPRGIDRFSRAVALALSTPLGVGGSGKWPSSFAASEEKELDTGVFSGVLRRSVLERFGGWDPGWPVNEDSELASRYLAAHERILGLRAMGAHYIPRASALGLARQYARYGFYRVKTAKRHPDSMRPSHLAPPLLLSVAIVSIAASGAIRAIGGLSLATYACAQILTCARVARSADKGEVALLPVVLTTMHLSFGAGYLLGCVRFGPPARALWRLTGRKLRKPNLSSPASPVTTAPSPREGETT
ncbi:MAG: glycosyltransferase [Arthrospira platensis]